MHPLHYMTFLADLYTSTQWVMPLGSPVRQSTKPTRWVGCTAFLFDSFSVIITYFQSKRGLRSNLTIVRGLHGPGGAERAAPDRQDRTALVLMPQSKPDLIPPAVFGKCQEPGIPALWRQNQEDQKFSYIVSSRSVWAI